MSKKLVIGLGITGGIIYLGIWITLSLIYKKWLLLFVLPVAIAILITGIILLILWIRKHKKEPEKLLQEIDTSKAKAELIDYLKEEYFDMIIPENEKVEHIGKPEGKQTPIFHFWGLSFCDSVTIHLLMNLESKKKNVLYDNQLYKPNLVFAMERLAENPPVTEEIQTVPQVDELGNISYKTIKKRLTPAQKEKEKTETEIAEKEGL